MTDDLPDSPLWDALLGPGTDDELAGEGAALAAFRAAQPSRRRRVQRLGVVGGAGLAIFVAAGAGVAAAVTGHLPAPVQDALAFLPAVPAHHEAAPHLAPTPRPTPSRPGPTATAPSLAPVPNSSPGSSAARVVSPGAASSPAPSATPEPSSSPTGSPQASASPTPGPPRPAILTAALSATTVTTGSDVVVTGRLGRDDRPLPGKTVFLARQYPGQSGWTRIGQGTTDSGGQVQISAPSLTRNVLLRLAAAGVVSGSHKVTVLPVVRVTVTVPAAGKRRLDVTTDGAVAGDTVQLLRLDGSSWTRVATHELDANAASAFTVPAAPPGSKVRYRVRVVATSRHGTGLHAVTLSSRG